MTLPDSLERVPVGGGALYVFAGAAGYFFSLLVAHVTDAFGGDADYEAPGWELAALLDVGPGPDADRLCVAAQHGPVPDARFFVQVDVPDDVGSRRDPGRRCDPGEGVAVGKHVTFVVQIQRGTFTLYSRYTSPNFRSR